MTSFKATLAFGRPITNPVEGSATGTLLGYPKNATAAPVAIELDDTLGIDASVAPASLLSATVQPGATAARTTVLPRRRRTANGQAEPVLDDHPRFEVLGKLGEGANGTVELVRDNDIRRTVAVKKIRGEVLSDGALMRFADEVRIVGQLEHPSIVPVYDVGRDEQGDVYLMMKHLDGETLEDILEKLRAGDPAYLERFTIAHRAHLFLGVLDALAYAHARGIIHRDLKPANIMIGRFGEVTVMDWGIAKPIGKREASEPSLDAASSWLRSQDQRLLETQIGALAGTPLYMSPEQAAGLNDTLDARSDVYALAVLFYELLTLEHPLPPKTTLMEVLAGILTTDYDRHELAVRGLQHGVPCELSYLVYRGLARNREERLASAGEMHDQLKQILDGKLRVECPVTFTKRASNEAIGLLDRRPSVFMGVLAFTTVAALIGLGTVVVVAIRWLG